MPSNFREGGRWMENRWDRDGDLFIQKRRAIDRGRKKRILRLKERKNKRNEKGEKRETCRWFGGLMTICTAHWSERTTSATLAQPRKSYPYIWYFTGCISYLIQRYYLPAIDTHHQSWPARIISLRQMPRSVLPAAVTHLLIKPAIFVAKTGKIWPVF